MSAKRMEHGRRGVVPCAECGEASWSGLCGRCKASAGFYADQRRKHPQRCACGQPGTKHTSGNEWECDRCAELEKIGYERYTHARETTRASESVWAESR